MKNSAKDLLQHIRLPSADWFGIREVTETNSVRFVRDGKPFQNSATTSHGAMVEVLVDGQFGYAATPSLSAKSIADAALRAAAQAKAASQFKIHAFSRSQRPDLTVHYESPIKQPLESLSAGEINSILIKACETLKVSPKVVRTEAMFNTTEVQISLASSSGSDARQRFTMVSANFAANAQEGLIVQRRTDSSHYGRSYHGGWERQITPDFWDRLKKVGEEAVELLSAEDCPTGTMDLILAPDQMMLQIHESIGHALELDRILGDERNYAGWSFVKPEDFGKLRYGSPLLNITFDPTIAHEYASYGFDDIGHVARKEFLIKEGILQRALGSLESQARSGIPGVANQRACLWNRPPIDRMANLNLEPGCSRLDQIVGSVKRGVLMRSNRSWSIDDFRNKFQFGCEYGKLIEDGRITRTVRNSNYRGVSVPFWNSLKMVGDASTFEVYGTPNCGKGEPNQSIRVGHASPVCLFENVEIFGGSA